MQLKKRPNDDLKFENMGYGKSFLYQFPVSEFYYGLHTKYFVWRF